MPLPVMMEPPEHDMPSERCVFCSNHTRMWHMESNTPVCKTCAEKEDVGSLHAARKAPPR
jgi:hypothetical protein